MNLKHYKPKPLLPFILITSAILSPVSKSIETQINKCQRIGDIYSYLSIFSLVPLVMCVLWLIDKYGWKYKIFKWLVDIPNINGRYKGKLVSSFIDNNGNNTEMDCIIEISQTASKIELYAYFGNIASNQQSSETEKTYIHISKLDNDQFQLEGIFTNKPEITQTINPVQSLNSHKGALILKYYPDIKTLKGEYFNQRLNKGSIEVTFEQKKLIKRLL